MQPPVYHDSEQPITPLVWGACDDCGAPMWVPADRPTGYRCTPCYGRYRFGPPPATVIASNPAPSDPPPTPDPTPAPPTVDNVAAAALAAGYTHVATSAGPCPLESWTPYGKRAGHHVHFYLDRAAHAITEASPDGSTRGAIFGHWALTPPPCPGCGHATTAPGGVCDACQVDAAEGEAALAARETACGTVWLAYYPIGADGIKAAMLTDERDCLPPDATEVSVYGSSSTARLLQYAVRGMEALGYLVTVDTSVLHYETPDPDDAPTLAAREAAGWAVGPDPDPALAAILDAHDAASAGIPRTCPECARVWYDRVPDTYYCWDCYTGDKEWAYRRQQHDARAALAAQGLPPMSGGSGDLPRVNIWRDHSHLDNGQPAGGYYVAYANDDVSEWYETVDEATEDTARVLGVPLAWAYAETDDADNVAWAYPPIAGGSDEAGPTPGPWRVADASAGSVRFAVYSGDQAAGTEQWLAEVHGPWRNRRYSASEARANARLMAAAPDLLAALEALTGYADGALGWLNALHGTIDRERLAESMPNNFDRAALCNAIADAHRALNSATGR